MHEMTHDIHAQKAAKLTPPIRQSQSDLPHIVFWFVLFLLIHVKC